ncbi:dolichyl-diphosphooligosaccharide--protein glycosyltransferase subunit STT3 [archaeon]|nr:dolichyl-diphosphooligosaccharide--protein glycosyltransferase subunit STT3 [archaeon]
MKRDKILYLSPVFLSTLITAYIFLGLKTNTTAFNVISSLFLIFCPGVYLSLKISQELELSIDEFIMMCVPISITVVTFSYLILTFISSNVNQLVIYSVMTLFLAISGYSIITQNNYNFIKKIETLSVNLASLTTMFFIGFLIIMKKLPTDFWWSIDGWETVNVVLGIMRNSFSHIEAFDYFRTYMVYSNPGFYHYLSAFCLATNIHIYDLMRFGAPFFSGFFIALVYLLIKRINGALPGMLNSFLFILTPYYYSRFTVLLRENHSYLFFITSLFLLQAYIDRDKKISTTSTVLIGLMFASCLITHPMTPFLLYGVIVIHSLYLLYNNNDTISDVGKIIASSLIFGAPFSINMIVTLTNFNNKIISYNGLLLTCAIAFIIPIGIKYKKNILAKSDEFKPLFYVFLLLVPVVSVGLTDATCYFFDRGISINDLQKTLVPLAITGFIINYFGSVKQIAVYLHLIVSSILFLGVFNYPIPANRLVLPISLCMSIYASNILKVEEVTEKNEIDIHQMKKTILSNKTTITIIIFIITGGILEVSHFSSTYTRIDSYDIANTKMFIKGVEQNDLVVTHSYSYIMLHFCNISRSNIITNVTIRSDINTIYNYDSPYNISNIVSRNYPEKDRLILYTPIRKGSGLEESEIYDALSFYFKKEEYGPYNAYELGLPFNVKELDIELIKFIEDEETILTKKESILSNKEVLDVSNVIKDSSNMPYKIYYLVKNTFDNSRYIGLLHSSDGINWTCYQDWMFECDLDSLHAIVNDSYTIIGETVEKNQLLRFDSVDGIRWGNETILLDYTDATPSVYVESPIIWKMENHWELMYWETRIGDMGDSGLRYLRSVDGAEWIDYTELVNWNLRDDASNKYDYDKILLSDVILNDDNIVFIGKFSLIDDVHLTKTWRTGTLTIDEINHTAPTIRCLIYKDHLDSRVTTTNVIQINDTNRFYYIIDETKQVILGSPSDHFLLPEEYLLNP